MSGASDRRRALQGLAALALAPMAASRALAAVPGPTGFAPPLSPLRYTRRLERFLGDGNSIVVERAFAVRFARSADGFRLDGSQIAVEVSMPERIAALARLERERIEDGLFPLQLSPDGVIVAGPDHRPSPQLDEAVAVVARGLAEIRGTSLAEAADDSFLRAVHGASAALTASLPANLFAPPGQPLAVQQEVALPGGGSGTIAVRFSATRDPATGLMHEARREVVTAIGEDRRLTREEFALAPLS